MVDTSLASFLTERAKNGFFSFVAQQQAADLFKKSLREIEEAALRLSLVPKRYLRNSPVLSSSQQLQLFGSTVAVIGCGGLGGYVIEELARIGIGRIIAMDPDRYEEHNMNRQLQSEITVLGQLKVKVIQKRVGKINPVVDLTAIEDKFSGKLTSPLDQAQVIVDALDTVSDRRLLAEACNQQKKTLVHGAVDGWYGQVAVILPGSNSFSRLYPRHNHKTGPGVLSFTVATVASLQASETCKLLLKMDSPLHSHCLAIDLRNCETELIPL